MSEHMQTRSNILLQHLVEYQLIGRVAQVGYSVRKINNGCIHFVFSGKLSAIQCTYYCPCTFCTSKTVKGFYSTSNTRNSLSSCEFCTLKGIEWSKISSQISLSKNAKFNLCLLKKQHSAQDKRYSSVHNEVNHTLHPS